jgi:hypothetical protein
MVKFVEKINSSKYFDTENFDMEGVFTFSTQCPIDYYPKIRHEVLYHVTVCQMHL